MMDGAGMMGGSGMMGGMVVLWVLFVIVLLALAVTALVWLVRNMSRSGSEPTPQTSRDELDRRYAAGQIDRDHYLEVRRDLEG